jgi:hypothetical protein
LKNLESTIEQKVFVSLIRIIFPSLFQHKASSNSLLFKGFKKWAYFKDKAQFFDKWGDFVSVVEDILELI